MLAHQTSNGCPIQVGDLIGSGTISGTTPGSRGSLLEASNGGKEAYVLSDSVRRTFLEDGDCVTITGSCGTAKMGIVGFGECRGTILPACLPAWLERE